jgi:membrane-bound lytic murein transglycosylase B
MSNGIDIPAAFVIAALILAPAGAFAQDDFKACLTQLRAKAVADGIPPARADAVLSTVHQRPQVVEADRNQPELIETFADYLGRRVTDRRIEMGREALRRYADVLARVEAKYGVPAEILVAFWGLETDYGRVLGDVPIFDSLATLACGERRAEYFTTELVNALEIVGRDGVRPAEMTGSWAGAMGHTQFMPSVYLEDAVDGDGDGVVDLWHSVPDAFASAANFLRRLGWKRGWRWGREVELPDGFDYYQSGLERSRTLAEWRRAGVRRTDGRLVDGYDERASLLLPAGHEGPAFLVYANFGTVMKWNRSELFALAIALLSDRIAGGGPLHHPPPNQPRTAKSDIEALQRELNAQGFDSGVPDGIIGSATRQAVREWQHAHARIADGHIDSELLQRLGIKD